ncbi:Hypothetical protein R9X50_00355200 [Acrodontium crateriforme]|uniref:NTF2-like domain-containing protein n=1 Tax=Acrodontium crateriforme TaxID=150365 RepID=A0AAQ3M9A0_9PEZI|nr:Hypothetical protein R9X50_00355200 [Acrodontium crateriforme]
MRFSVIATVSTLATGAFSWSPPWYRGSTCLDYDHAQHVANNFKGTIDAYTTTLANKIFTSDFHDYSDSVIELINGGCPSGPKTLGQPTFSSLADFEAGQGSQPNITFNILNLWYNCDTVFMRWEGPQPNPYSTAAQEPVRGIIVLETVTSKKLKSEPYLIKTVYSEFNSGAWLYDLGVFVPTNCTAASRKRDSKLARRTPVEINA